MAYHLEGRLLEVCNCRVLCPCWIGEDPDNGTCSSVVAYHLDSGTIRGVDVGGLTLASVVFIPGNVLAGNWQQLLYVDDQGSLLPETDHERIFEPFYRPAGHREGKDGGVGLGLALVRSIAEHHGGTVRYLAHEGHSRFEVRLPIDARSTASSQAPS